MNRVRKELELLKSWGFETVSIDKVLEMIERADDTETESDEKSVINIFYPPYAKEEGVEKYFREIPMYVTSDRTSDRTFNRTFNRGNLLSPAREYWYT